MPADTTTPLVISSARVEHSSTMQVVVVTESDWATVVTGVVGLAGIGGTLFAAWLASRSQTKNLQLSINAENERQRLADKRRIYAKFMESVTAVIGSALKLQRNRADATEEEVRAMVTAVDEATGYMVNTGNEVVLIGPPSLGTLAEEIRRELADRVAVAQRGRIADLGFQDRRRELYEAMRADLGESRSSQTSSAPVG
jgi:hypothetical protein